MQNDIDIFRGIKSEIQKNPENFKPAGQWLDGYCQNVIKKAKQHRKNLPQIISEKQKEAKRIKGLHGKTRKEFSKLKDKSEINEQEEEKLSGLVAKANQLSLKVYDLKRELEHLKGKSQDEPGFIQLMSKAFEKASCEYPRNHIKIMVIVWLLTDEYLHKSKIGITKYEQYVFKHEIIEPEGTGLKRTISEQELARDAVLYAEPEAMKIVRDAWAHFQENEKPAETGQKSKPAEEPSKEAKNVFKKDGDFWQVAYQSNDTTTIKDIKGMSYIARLLEKPNEPIAALSLANPKSDTKLMIQGKAVENDTVSSDSGKPQEIIDKDTLQSCQKRIIDIKNELADAEKNNDLAAQERLEAEKEQILSELNAARNLKGESRSFTDNLDKARKAVTNAIKRALENIKTHSMPLYQHLDNSIQRGIDFAYKPDRQTNWQL